MKLYELTKGALFTIADDESKTLFTFDKVDGMYSICFYGEHHMIHLAAFTDIEEVII